jgi:hypothetical protein
MAEKQKLNGKKQELNGKRFLGGAAETQKARA